MSAKYDPRTTSIILTCIMQFNAQADEVKILVNGIEQDTEIEDSGTEAVTLKVVRFPDFPMGARNGVDVQVQIKPFAGQDFITETERLGYNPTANNAMMRYMY